MAICRLRFQFRKSLAANRNGTFELNFAGKLPYQPYIIRRGRGKGGAKREGGRAGGERGTYTPLPLQVCAVSKSMQTAARAAGLSKFYLASVKTKFFTSFLHTHLLDKVKL